MAKAPKKAPKKSAGARKPVAKKKPAKARSSAPRRSSGGRSGGYEIVCSECYSDFTFHSDSKASKIHCPECMHTGSVATSDVMSNISIAKSKERGAFLWAILPAVAFLACSFAWISKLNTTGEPISDTANYAFLGVGAILFIATVAMGVKYESNRYEVYF